MLAIDLRNDELLGAGVSGPPAVAVVFVGAAGGSAGAVRVGAGVDGAAADDDASAPLGLSSSFFASAAAASSFGAAAGFGLGW